MPSDGRTLALPRHDTVRSRCRKFDREPCAIPGPPVGTDPALMAFDHLAGERQTEPELPPLSVRSPDGPFEDVLGQGGSEPHPGVAHRKRHDAGVRGVERHHHPPAGRSVPHRVVEQRGDHPAQRRSGAHHDVLSGPGPQGHGHLLHLGPAVFGGHCVLGQLREIHRLAGRRRPGGLRRQQDVLDDLTELPGAGHQALQVRGQLAGRLRFGPSGQELRPGVQLGERCTQFMAGVHDEASLQVEGLVHGRHRPPRDHAAGDGAERQSDRLGHPESQEQLASLPVGLRGNVGGRIGNTADDAALFDSRRYAAGRQQPRLTFRVGALHDHHGSADDDPDEHGDRGHHDGDAKSDPGLAHSFPTW